MWWGHLDRLLKIDTPEKVVSVGSPESSEFIEIIHCPFLVKASTLSMLEDTIMASPTRQQVTAFSQELRLFYHESESDK